MGAHQSSPQLTLAEKRYRIGSPERLKKRKKGKFINENGINSTKQDSDTSSLNTFLNSKNKNSTSTTNSTINNKKKNIKNSESSTTLKTLSLTDIFNPQTAYHLSVNNGNILTKTQQILIKNSWKRSRKIGVDNVGTKIFLHILTAQPDIKDIFGLEKIPQGRLKYDPRFRKHAVVFNRTFEYIVKNLTFTEKLLQHFQSLGKKHVLMQGRGFLPQYWITFAESMAQTAIEWEGGYKCRETIISWRILVTFIIYQMRLGFDNENNNKRKYTLSTMPQAIRGSSVKSSPNHLSKQFSSQQCLKINNQHLKLQCKLSSNNDNELLNEEFKEKCKIINNNDDNIDDNIDDNNDENNDEYACCNNNKNADDNTSEKSVFFTPPSSRKHTSLICHSHTFNESINDQNLNFDDDDDNDEVWSSPRNDFIINK